MRFYHDAATEIPVEWYFADEERKVLPFAHAFGSQIYEREEGEEGDLGERFNPHPWRGGQPPCPSPTGGPCGTPEEWANGVSIDKPAPRTWPGTNIPECCGRPIAAACGGIATGRMGFGVCHMQTTCDIYSPFGAAAPTATNVPCQFVSNLPEGRGITPTGTVLWTDYIDVATTVTIVDGCTRTATLNVLNYNDGDEVRIPTGGATRYVVVWVSLCDQEGTVVKRCYLMRHSA
jgi:hypothetical protein